LGLQRHSLTDLEAEFTEEEVKAVIDDIAADKARWLHWHFSEEKLVYNQT